MTSGSGTKRLSTYFVVRLEKPLTCQRNIPLNFVIAGKGRPWAYHGKAPNFEEYLKHTKQSMQTPLNIT